MHYEDLIVLIPAHSLEDFPVEQGDSEAASLLNSCVIPWHPAFLATAKVLPRWHRADEPPDSAQRRLIMLPTCCESWIPAGWAERVTNEGSVVIRGQSERPAMLEAALAPLNLETPVAADLAADFLALGFCYLQVELLTRKMRHFSNMDEVHLQREAVAGAEAALAGDAETARSRLRSCFEVLTEARERFYPVDCYLIDLCLMLPRLADRHFTEMLLTLKPVNVLATSADLQEIATKEPDAHAALREAVERGSADIVGGEIGEAPLPLLPIGSVLWQFQQGQALLEKLFGRRAGIWGRRRYGLFPQLAQILKKLGYASGMHVALDDGIYPDEEHSKLRWEGPDGTVLDAISRIPLAADSASTYLRFSTRMSESMDNDHVAALIFARWPEVKAPWFEDLRRMHNFSPCLGRWVTFDDYFRHTDSSGRLSTPKAREYLTPYLVQSVARDEANPISRFADHQDRRQKLDSIRFLDGLRQLLLGKCPPAVDVHDLEKLVEDLCDRPATETEQQAGSILDQHVTRAAQQFGELIASTGKAAGYLVLNPLSFRRLVTVPLPAGAAPPKLPNGQSWLQWDSNTRALTVEVPGAGFAWIPAAAAGSSPPAHASGTPTAEANILRNEFFEVRLSEETGGIRQIKGYGRVPNRLSQQVNFRFPRERTFTVGEGEDAEEVKTQYGEMRRLTSEVVCSGPALGEIVTTGEIIDQKNRQRLAGFIQRYRVWRGRPIVEVEIELQIDRQPDPEPWHSYYAARFAWNDDDAALTRSVTFGAQELPDERFESPNYLEIAVGEMRTTILPLGLPFHRKTGPRMVDTLLVVPGEKRRRFKFVIAVDQPFPMQAALDAQVPALLVPTTGSPPGGSTAGWFLHLNTRSVQILEMLPLLPEPVESEVSWHRPEAPPPVTGAGCGLRLIETEGRPVHAKLRCFRPPTSARRRNFLGKTTGDLAIEGDAVLVDFAAYEIVELELRFDG